MAPLDPNVQGWQRAIEADAAAHFAGEPEPYPFGRCLYLWGEVAIYCIEYGKWTPLSAAVVVDRLIEARAQADEFGSGGPIAHYVLVRSAFMPAAHPAIIEVVAGIDLPRTTLIVAAFDPTWNQLVRHQTVEFG